METDKIKKDFSELSKEIRENKNFTDFDKDLILWIKEHKPIIYVIFRSVSRSGMLRRFSTFLIKNNDIYYLNNIIAEVSKEKRDDEGYIKVYGCGMDMAFKLVSDFSQVLFNNYNILNYRLI